MVVPPNIKKDKFTANLMSVNELESLRLTLVKRYELIQDKELVKDLHKNLEDLDAIINKVKLTEVYDPYNMGNKDVKYMETGAGSPFLGDAKEPLPDYISGVKYSYGTTKPEYCGSCHTKQTDMTTKYCEGCQKDPSYNATTSKVIDFMTAPKMMKFGTFEADYADFELFKQYMKFKNLSLNNQQELKREDAERRTEERKE
jgi:hypothetical protein